MQTTSKMLLVAVWATCGLMFGCDDDDDDRSDVLDEEDLALVRVVHASPGAPAVDVYASGADVPLATVAYGEASPYVSVPEGDYTFIIRVAGTDTLVYETELVALEEEQIVTAVAAGDVTSTDPASGFRIIPLFENFGDELAGQTRVRILHASPDAPAVDIDVNDDGVIEIPELARFGETGAEGVPLPADAELQVGIAAGGQRVTAFTVPALAAGDELFVIATGSTAALPRDPTGFSLLAVGPQGAIGLIRQNPTVYALHASPDAPSVDIRVGDTLLFSDLSYGEQIPAQVPPGDYTLAFSPAGDPSTVAATAPISGLAAGERYLAVATGMLTAVADEQRFQVALYQDQFTVDGMPRIRAIHASPDAPVVDISTLDEQGMLTSPPAITELGFGEATRPDGLAVPALAALRIGVAQTKTTAPVATFTLDTRGIPRAFVVAAGALTPAAGEQSFGLFVVNTTTSPWPNAAVRPD